MLHHFSRRWNSSFTSFTVPVANLDLLVRLVLVTWSLLLSNSGETGGLKATVTCLKNVGVHIIALTESNKCTANEAGVAPLLQALSRAIP